MKSYLFQEGDADRRENFTKQADLTLPLKQIIKEMRSEVVRLSIVLNL